MTVPSACPIETKTHEQDTDDGKKMYEKHIKPPDNIFRLFYGHIIAKSLVDEKDLCYTILQSVFQCKLTYENVLNSELLNFGKIFMFIKYCG